MAVTYSGICFITQAPGVQPRLDFNPQSEQRILKGEVSLTSCFTGLDQSVLQIKTKIVSCHTANFKPVKWEVNGAVILPPLIFPDLRIRSFFQMRQLPLELVTGREPLERLYLDFLIFRVLGLVLGQQVRSEVGIFILV